MPESQDNIIDWSEVQRILETPPVEEEDAPWESCKHFKVRLDDQSHTVTCRACEKQLDAFWYLQLLAKEWKHRRFHLGRLEELQKEIGRWNAEHEAKREAAKRFTARPERKGRAQETWDKAVGILGVEPPGIYRVGRYWYVDVSIQSARKNSTPSLQPAWVSIDYLEAIGRDRAMEEIFGEL